MQSACLSCCRVPLCRGTASAVVRGDLQHGAILFRGRGRLFRWASELFEVAKSAGGDRRRGAILYRDTGMRHLIDYTANFQETFKNSPV